MPKRSEVAQRLTLTGIWIAAFLACVVGIESYMWPNANGVALLVPQDRVTTLKPLLFLYGGYIAGILGFWFSGPFTPRGRKHVLHRIRFALAIWSTLVLNVLVVYFVWQNHLGSPSTIQESVSSATALAAWLSTIVAPANAYYFGLSGTTNAGAGASGG